MTQSWIGWYWDLCTATFLVISGAIAAWEDCALAQIAPDSTLGAESSVVTPIEPGSPVNEIKGGATRGANLFHSFEQFSIPTRSVAYFNNAPDIQNIISRVTGESISIIDGKLQANASANLFLLNPNGIIFGPNATLAIGGSFVGSTASSLNFADGNQFSATAHPKTPLLTVSVPLGLQYGSNPGPIVNQSRAVIDSSGRPVGLRVQPGKTLALLGGNVALEGGNLTAEAGRIELGSVAGPSFVSLTPIDKGWALGYEGVQNFQNIQLDQGAFVDASGSGGGDIHVQGRHVTVTSGSQIKALTLGVLPGGTLSVNASDALEVIGTSATGVLSGLFSSTQDAGAGGNLTITTTRLSVQGGARVSASSVRSGNAGKLSVNAKDSVELSGTSADQRNGSSALLSEAYGEGAAGDLTITTGRLIVQGGAQVSTATFGSGAGGSLVVNASQEVELIGTSADADNNAVSGLITSSQSQATGAAGNLTVNTRRLTIRDGAAVGSSALGQGIGGTLTVNASESVELSGTSKNELRPSLITARTTGAFNAGNVKIETGQLTVRERAQVTVSSTGKGDAGNLEVKADSIRLDNQAALSSNTTAGQGNISLRSEDLVLRRASNITTDAQRTAIGGNITINTGVIAALENSDIRANAQEGSGGQVIINAQGIFGTEFRQEPTEASDITASSNLGPKFSGNVEINTPDVDPSLGLVTLPTELVDASGLIASGCGAGGENQFIITGHGGLPPNPSDTLSSDAVWIDLRPLRKLARTRSSSEEATNPTRRAPTQIVEAQGWAINDKGNVVLTATAPTVTPHIPWITSESCHTP